MEINSSDIHSFYLSIENSRTLRDWQSWCSERTNWPLVAIPLYLLAIVYGKNMMRDRKPVSCKNLLFLWNASLAAFSIIGVIRMFANVSHQIMRHGFTDSVCVNRPDNVTALWVYLFTMSKFAELGDTLFLVIRKRTVMFLHWYHHCTVLAYTWFAFTHDASTGKYFILMNYFVHSLMYTYFAAQSVNIKAPRFVSMTITSLQILQMIGGIAVLGKSIYESQAGSGCSVHPNILVSGVLMYGSYFALFVQFFIQSYFGKRPAKAATVNNNSITTATANTNTMTDERKSEAAAAAAAAGSEPVVHIKSL